MTEESGKRELADDTAAPRLEQPVIPWFADKEGTVLFYRVNRRPFPQPTFFSEQPASILDHIVEVLLFGEEVLKEGRSARRIWLLGNRRIDLSTGSITGRVGWESINEVSVSRFDHGENEWVDSIESNEKSAWAPFVFDAGTQILAILKHPSFPEKTLANVFEEILRRGETARPNASTEWSVEALLAASSFYEWLSSMDAVLKVTLVSKLPNPGISSEFYPVWGQMEERKARIRRLELEAADEREGLVGIGDDEEVRAGVAMAEASYGYVTGRGVRRGRRNSFDGRNKTRRVETEPLPANWAEVAGMILRMARGQ